MRTRDYIEATADVLRTSDDPGKVIAALKSILSSRGHNRLYRSILQGLMQRIDEYNREGHALVTLARESDNTVFKDEIRNALRELDAHEPFETQIDETVIGGYRVTANDSSIDRTYKKRLLAIYQSVIEPA